MPVKSQHTVCYVLAYRSPDYIRTLSLLRALRRMAGVSVVTAINRPRGWLRYFDTLWQLAKVRVSKRPDCYVLGFRGHEIFWPVRLLTLGKPLIFDSLMSPYSALAEERKHGSLGAALSRLVYYVEKSILRSSSHILTDTQLHVDYLVDIFDLHKDRVSALPVGATEDAAGGSTVVGGLSTTIDATATAAPLDVLFYGSFLPLHGMSVMLEAAALLRESPIRFTFIGGSGSELATFESTVSRLRLTNVSHVAWIPYADLLDERIPEADLCLGGPFGNTAQARRVVTGKTSQCLAMAKATVIGRIDEEIGFIDKVNCLLVDQGNPAALAAALQWAASNRDRLPEIGAGGRALYRDRLSVQCIANKLETLLEDVLPRC